MSAREAPTRYTLAFDPGANHSCKLVEARDGQYVTAAAYDALAAERDEAVELADRRLAFMRAEGDVVNQVLEAVRSHMKSGDTVVTCVTRLSGVMATLEETIERLADAQGALSMCHQGAEYMLWMLRKAKEQQEAAERERDALRGVAEKAREMTQAHDAYRDKYGRKDVPTHEQVEVYSTWYKATEAVYDAVRSLDGEGRA